MKEIGDGNLNYVFRVIEEATGKSVIVKQAGEALRISAEMHVSTDRNRIESEILQLQDKYAPGSVPKIFGYDTVMCACCMEDLSDHELMRYALMRHETFPQFADDISTYMVNTLLKTTDVAMEHKAKKALVKSFINPELCEITEDLVLMEPYNDKADDDTKNRVMKVVKHTVVKNTTDPNAANKDTNTADNPDDDNMDWSGDTDKKKDDGDDDLDDDDDEKKEKTPTKAPAKDKGYGNWFKNTMQNWGDEGVTNKKLYQHPVLKGPSAAKEASRQAREAKDAELKKKYPNMGQFRRNMNNWK